MGLKISDSVLIFGTCGAVVLLAFEHSRIGGYGIVLLGVISCIVHIGEHIEVYRR